MQLDSGDGNETAKWIAAAVGALVLLWKMFYNLRRDQRDDSEGKGRVDLIKNLQEEVRRQSALIVQLDETNARLEKQLDDEVQRRRDVEADLYRSAQREGILRRRLEGKGNSK